MLKSGHLPHYLFLETSIPSDYILDDFTVLYLHVQDKCFFLNEEHERTCKATKNFISFANGSFLFIMATTPT